MDIELLRIFVAAFIGLGLGAGIFWGILSHKIILAHERGRSEGQVELATMRERVAQADHDLGELRNQLNILRTSLDESRRESETARQQGAALTTKTEQIPQLMADLDQNRQELKAVEAKLAAAQSDLAGLKENRDGLSIQADNLKMNIQNCESIITALTAERDSLAKVTTELETTLKNEREQRDKDLTLLINAREALTHQFRTKKRAQAT